MSKDPMQLAGELLAGAVAASTNALRDSDRGDRAGALRWLLELEKIASGARHQLVAELRNSGSSWPELGELLGISKQGAAKVYDNDSARLMNAEARYRRELRDAERATEVVAGPQLADVAPAVPVAAPAVDVPLDLEPVNVTGGPVAWDEAGDGSGHLDRACELCDVGPGEPCTRIDGSPVLPSPQKDGSWDQWTHATRRGYTDPAWAWEQRGKSMPVPATGGYSVTCPRCAAAPGADCVTTSGRVTPVHQLRMAAFLARDAS